MTKKDNNPFPGPRPFTYEERGFFFGREEEIADLKDLLCSYSLVLLYSQSGSGKSSLLQAGLRPLFDNEPGDFAIVRLLREPAQNTASTLSNVFVDAILRNFSTPIGVTSLSELYPREDQPRRRILVLDQFEELFTYLPDRWEDRRVFLAQISCALETNPELRILLVLREEYLGQLASYADLLPLNLQIRYRLERLKADAATEAIQRPFEAAEVCIDSDLVKRIVIDLSLVRARRDGQILETKGEFVEPVHLQVVCRDIWERSFAVGVAPPSIPDQLESVDHALQSFYEKGIKDAVGLTSVRESRVRRWFDERAITSSGTRRVLFRDEHETEGLDNSVIDSLEKNNLVRTEPRASEQTSELTHDRLIGPIRHSNASFRRRKRIQALPFEVVGGTVLVLLVAVGCRSVIHQWRHYKTDRRLVAESNQARNEDLAGLKLSTSQRPKDRAASRIHYEDALGHYLKAVSLGRSIQSRGNQDELISALISLARQRGPYRKRVIRILEASEADPSLDQITRERLLLSLADLYLTDGRTLDSEAAIRRIDLNSLPDEEKGHVDEVFGRALYRQMQLDEADAHFKRALGETPSTDAEMRYTLMLDKALVETARGRESNRKKAIPILTTLELGTKFHKEKDLQVGDPPKLLTALATAQALDGSTDYATRIAYNSVSSAANDEYYHALALTTLGQVLMRGHSVKTNVVLDDFRQATIDLASISTKAEPYDPVLSAMLLVSMAKAHILQIRLRRTDTIFPSCAGHEEECARMEIGKAEEILRSAQDAVDMSYVTEARQLLTDSGFSN